MKVLPRVMLFVSWYRPCFRSNPLPFLESTPASASASPQRWPSQSWSRLTLLHSSLLHSSLLHSFTPSYLYFFNLSLRPSLISALHEGCHSPAVLCKQQWPRTGRKSVPFYLRSLFLKIWTMTLSPGKTNRKSEVSTIFHTDRVATETPRLSR